MFLSNILMLILKHLFCRDAILFMFATRNIKQYGNSNRQVSMGCN